jgi:superfamily II DNA or RNA helicase
MRFIRKDPDKGYVTTNLLLPKRHINPGPIKTALTFILPDKEEVIDPMTGEAVGERNKRQYLWDETEHHLIVPREFYTSAQIERITGSYFEIEDLRHYEYPRAGITTDIELREAQLDPFQAMLEAGGGTLNLKCGGGKTILALYLMAYHDVPTIIVVNNTLLLEQWQKEIREHIQAPSIRVVQGQRMDWRGASIVVAMIHTLAGKPELRSEEFRRHFGLSFYDEGHHMSAQSFVRGADLCSGLRYSLTATAERTDGLENIYKYHLGRVFYRDLEQDLVPLTTFHVMRWRVPSDDLPEIRDVSGTTNMSKFRVYIGTLAWRNNLIIRDVITAMEAGRQCMVLSHSVEHVRLLGEELARIYPGTGMIYGNVDQTARMGIVERSNPVVAIFQLSREGLDKRSLSSIFVTTPFGNSNDLQQAWGRGQREFEGKPDPEIHVYEDYLEGYDKGGICRKSCLRLRKYLRGMRYPATQINEGNF